MINATKYQPISPKFSWTAFLMLPQLLIVKTRRNYHVKPVFQKYSIFLKSSILDRLGWNYMYGRVINRTLLRKCLNYQIQSLNDNYLPKTVSLAWSTPTIDQKSNSKHSKPLKTRITLLAINSSTVRRYLDFDLGKFDHQKGAFCDKISHKWLASDVN